MTFDYTFILDTSIKLLVSMLLGAIIGAEREYKGRNIGFRTIILITLGSTFFTI
jgi:putative Mg2+ transporter-C (MgtC) family protein